MKKTILVTCVLTALCLQGCGKKDAAQHLQDAQGFIAKQEYPAAVIELKAALQQEPDNAKVRQSLGNIYLQLGDALSAIKEFERALSLDMELNEVAKPLAQAYFLAGQFPKLAELGKKAGLDSASQDFIALYQALSAIEASEAADAKTELERLKGNQDAGISSMASAQLAIMDKQFDQALQSLDAVPADNPLFRESILLKAKLFNIQGKLDDSVASFQQYLKLNPAGHQARLLLAQTFVAQDKFAEASKELDPLLKMFPKQPLANYLKAVIAFEAKDFQKAKELSEVAITSGLSSVSTRVLAALAASQLGLSNQALAHLHAVRNELGSYPPAQKLYVALQLQSGNTDAAQQQILKDPAASGDVQLVTATAFQLLKRRANGAAEELVSKYEQDTATKSEQDLIAIGALKLGIPGQEAQGLQLLEQAAKQAPEELQAKMLLASAYLQQQKFAELDTMAKSWLQDDKLKMHGLNMLAYSAVLQGKDTEAQQYIEQAVSGNSELPFTYLLKAASEMAKNNTEAATTTLNGMLTKFPNYLPAIEQLYGITREQSPSPALQKIEALNTQNPQNYPAAVLYARMLVDQKQQSKAVEVLEAAKQPVAERNPLHWALLVEYQRVEKKDIKGSLALATEWYQQASADKEAVYTYIRALILDKQLDKALSVNADELKKSPDDKVLFGTQVQLLAETAKYDEALAMLAKIPAAEAAKPDVQFIKGRILLATGKLDQALTALNESYQQSQATMTALMIADTLDKQGKLSEAKAFAEAHLATRPQDGPLQLFYANLMLKLDKQKSITLFKELLAKEPNNAAVLNNLAYTLLESNQLQEASTHIEKAVRLAPENPDILDTYGAVLLASGKVDQALTQFEASLKVRPDNTAVQLNYADALIKKGDKKRAKTVLDKAAQQKDAPKQQVDALYKLL
jgi:putative PEP-CTERM system TPR-repeat lipoprotein